MSNTLLNHIIKKRKGHYCHDIEVKDVYEIEAIVEAIFEEFNEDYSARDIIEFFESITVHYTGEGDDTIEEDLVYTFDFKECISGLSFN